VPFVLARCEDARVTDRRSADELRQVPDPAWPEIASLIAEAPVDVRVLAASASRRDIALETLQVTARSFLGAIVGECGALLVDHGWLRILGAGAEGLPGVHEANAVVAGPTPLLEVAWDAVGGRFAVNGGGIDAPLHEVCYWGPDTLDWVPIGGGHSAFVTWALAPDGLADFYESLRWAGWEREVAVLAPDQGLSLWPPPFTAEGKDPGRATRGAVPLTELHAVYAELAQQLRDPPGGPSFDIKVTE
jgi:hypothetical protein